jgi:hypothetical protein
MPTLPRLKQAVEALRTIVDIFQVGRFLVFVWGLLAASQIFQTTRDVLWQSLSSTLLSQTIQWQWKSIMIDAMLGVLVWETLRYFLSRLTRGLKRDYFFRSHPTSTLTWKATATTGELEKTPYCRVHKTMLIRNGNGFLCSDCGSLRVGHTSIAQADLEYHLVAAQAKAIIEGHYHRTPILPLRIVRNVRAYTFWLNLKRKARRPK